MLHCSATPSNSPASVQRRALLASVNQADIVALGRHAIMQSRCLASQATIAGLARVGQQSRPTASARSSAAWADGGDTLQAAGN